jgi:hypothetical protein
VYLVNQDEDLLPRFAQRLDTPGKLVQPHNYYSLSFVYTRRFAEAEVEIEELNKAAREFAESTEESKSSKGPADEEA